MNIQISCDRNWKRMTRPRFVDVRRSVQEQVDDFDGDLSNALIIALPKGASPKQVERALNEIMFGEGRAKSEGKGDGS
jgi:hypothetical protein